MLFLASFLAFFISTNRNSQVVAENEIQAVNTIVPDKQTMFVKRFPSNNYDEEQEEIRNEIMYGEEELLALLIEAEAGNQDEIGKRYVADVVLNRVEDVDFPDNVYDVIYQIHPTQFATIKDGAIEKAGYTVNDEDFRIAMEEYEGPRKDTTIFYFTSGKYNDSGTPKFQYGAHFFSTK